MRTTYDYLFKVLLFGDGDVGKTDILFRFEENDLNTTFISSIGADCKIRYIELDGKIIKLQIWFSLWDTADQERFQKITTAYYKGATHACPGVEIMLLGNNCHIKDKRQVNKDTGESFAAQHNMSFMEVSADANVNIQKALIKLTRLIMNKQEEGVYSI